MALALALAAAAGCAGPRPQTVDVGRHRVRFVLPAGWEHLALGRQQLFRHGEAQVSLVDLGPATPAGMVRELREADRLWRSGFRRDAFERVRGLHGPSLRYLSSQQRADFWKPWTDVTYVPDAADSAAIGPAFQTLISAAAALPAVTPEHVLEYVLLFRSDPRRREVGHRDARTIHGRTWVEVETWDRVSHLDRSRFAYLEHDGNLLVLAIDHGRFEEASAGFEALLVSFDVEEKAPAFP